MRAAIIPADLSQPVRIETVTFTEIRTIVGGYIQALSIREMDAALYTDEEAKLKGSIPVNPRASAITATLLNMDAPILGDVVLVGAADGEGNETDLSDQVVEVLESVFSAGRI